jgi:hypothetical protein
LEGEEGTGYIVTTAHTRARGAAGSRRSICRVVAACSLLVGAHVRLVADFVVRRARRLAPSVVYQTSLRQRSPSKRLSSLGHAA